MSNHPNIAGQYPVLPLRTEVQLPGNVAPLEIGRDASVRAVEAATKDDNLLVVVPQKNPSVREPGKTDLLDIGVRAEIVQVVRHSPGRLTAVLRFLERVRLTNVVGTEPFVIAEVTPVAPSGGPVDVQTTKVAREHLAAIVAEAKQHREAKGDKGDKNRREDPSRASILALVDPDQVVDTASAYLDLERDDLTYLLTETDSGARLSRILPVLERKAAVLRMRADIGAELEGESSKTHREKVLRDRARQIQEELGESDENAEIDELRQKLDNAKLPDDARLAARKQIGRMSQMAPSSPEYSIARTYVETLLEIPFGVYTEDTIDVSSARAILEAEHAGLAKVKKRILEFIAVKKLAPDKQGPILLLAGPPGVGKTSLGRSIAQALGRKYVRASLGGVHDEAEIRGHRRTYIGALPGRIVSGLKKAGSMNPVFVLDEIDKLTADMRGDPSAAMLEVLDPEQNKEFVDHYVELPIDLSRVMFICTANNLETISQPLFDRMELVELPGYTQLEKVTIGRNHLLPKQLAEHGMEKGKLTIDDETIGEVVHSYTREAGVRNLERELAGVCRAAAVKIASGEAETVNVTKQELVEILGPARYTADLAGRHPEVGVVTGLAWMPTGGDIMFIEVRVFPGKGDIRLTGQLGDVMKESATAAVSWVRTNAKRLGIDHDQILASDIHIHFPQGAIKKDGPSAGVALTCAVVSALTQRKVRNDIAITGEIDLRGHALPIGGVKEKVLAAHRAGIKIVFLPERNKKDAIEIPNEVQKDLEIRYMSKIDDALEVALGAASEKAPVPIMPPTTPPAGRGKTEHLPS